MSMDNQVVPVELHLFSPVQNLECIELLTAIAHYHRTSPFNLGHTVNFGRPWLPESKCSYGLVSLPYLDGSALEWATTQVGKIRCLWLIPITAEEVSYKKQNGLEALEEKFDERSLDYLNPTRASVV